MFGRQMKDKIPMLRDWTCDLDEEARERDTIVKGKMKERADKSSGARESDVKTGDKVFLRNKPGDKLTTNFSPGIFTVMEKKGGDCVVRSE